MKLSSFILPLLPALFLGTSSHAAFLSYHHQRGVIALKRSTDSKSGLTLSTSRLYYRNDTVVGETSSLETRTASPDNQLGLDYAPISLFGKGKPGIHGDKRLLGGKGANLAQMVSHFNYIPRELFYFSNEYIVLILFILTLQYSVKNGFECSTGLQRHHRVL